MLAGSYFYLFFKSCVMKYKICPMGSGFESVERIVSINPVLELSNIEICFLSHCLIDH